VSGEPELHGETLERLRRGFRLRIDRLGNFSIADEAVTHGGIDAALRAGLDLADDGRPIVRLGEQWTWLEVADCPLRVLRVAAVGDPPRPLLVLDDGRTTPLDPARVAEDPDGGLRCAVPARLSGRALDARFTNTAQMDLDRWIAWPSEDRPTLCIAGESWPIARRG
jgi:hypothetical protein